jgi:hypothetical protein
MLESIFAVGMLQDERGIGLEAHIPAGHGHGILEESGIDDGVTQDMERVVSRCVVAEFTIEEPAVELSETLSSRR